MISVASLFAIALVLPMHAQVAAQATPVNAEVVLNEFLATYAKANSAWKTGIEQIASPEAVPPGKQLGQSAVIGFYAFRPKLWSELSAAERKVVFADQRLTAFIISRISATQFPTVGIQAPDTPKFPIEGATPVAPDPVLLPVVAPPPRGLVSNVQVTPEQMLSAKPVEIRFQ